MPKTIADEHIALVEFAAPPADIEAITEEEWNAAEPLQCRIMDFRLSPVASDTVQQSELCEGNNAQVPTKSNYEGSITIFRYLDADGIPDPVNDVAFDSFRLKGTTHYLGVRQGPEHDAAAADGQEYSYFEAIQDHPTEPTDRGGFIRKEVVLLVQKAALDKVIGGES